MPLVSGHVPQSDHTPDATPSYPEQGATVLPNALRSLLPAGVAPHDARLLYVHAHPDDETVVTGASIAHYAREGAAVTLLTMTRGERGEVIPHDLRHLEVGHPDCVDDGTALGDYRVDELRAACAALGISKQFFAGQSPAWDPTVGMSNGRDRYLDSGMSWGAHGRAQPATDVSPAALTAAPTEEVAAHIAAAIRTVCPIAVITYDDDGGYGHPDHIYTGAAVLRAVELARTAGAGGVGWDVPVVWAIEGEVSADDVSPQAVVEATPGDLGAKRAALEAHATQVMLPSDPTHMSFMFSNGIPQKISGVETFRVVGGTEASAMEARYTTPAHSGRNPLDQASVPVSMAIAVVTGLLAGILGTGVHGNIARVGEGFVLPWGVALALALALSVSLWSGSSTRRVWAAAVAGVVTYTVAFVMAFLRPDSPLIVLALDSAIGRVGIAWFGGILLTTLASVMVVSRWWRRRRNWFGA